MSFWKFKNTLQSFFKTLLSQKNVHCLMKIVTLLMLVILSLQKASASSGADNTDIVNIRDIQNIKKNIDYTHYTNINGGKVKNTQTSENVFFTENSEKFIIEAKYTGDIRKLSSKNKDFLKEWLLAKYDNKNNVDRSLMLGLQEYQFDLFYKEIYMVYNGGGQRFIIQKAVADKLQKENIKNASLKFNVTLLGFLNKNDDYFLITGYSKDAVPQNISKNDYILAKNAILDERYDYAYTKIQNYLKLYPNNLDAKKDLCVIDFVRFQKFLDNKVLIKAIECFENMSVMYKKSEINYMLALLYYKNTLIDDKVRLTKVLSNLNDAINLIGNRSNLTLDENLVYYNALYLRGIMKLEYGDNSGLNDLSIVERERPDLVDLNTFEKVK
jgi:hypothetical protein